MRLVGTPGDRTATDATLSAAPEIAEQAPEAGATGAGSADSATKQSPPPTTASANLYVVFGGNVYAHSAVSTQTPSQPQVMGEAFMTFSSGTAPRLRGVYKGPEAESIYIANDAGEMQGFVPVKRFYNAAEYHLKSAAINGYGAWPTLPPDIPKPVPESNPSGAPAFELDGKDASGTPVYRRSGLSAKSGIAIAPGTQPGDPAAGNPNWTWWAP